MTAGGRPDALDPSNNLSSDYLVFFTTEASPAGGTASTVLSILPSDTAANVPPSLTFVVIFTDADLNHPPSNLPADYTVEFRTGS